MNTISFSAVSRLGFRVLESVRFVGVGDSLETAGEVDNFADVVSDTGIARHSGLMCNLIRGTFVDLEPLGVESAYDGMIREIV